MKQIMGLEQGVSSIGYVLLDNKIGNNSQRRRIEREFKTFQDKKRKRKKASIQPFSLKNRLNYFFLSIQNISLVFKLNIILTCLMLILALFYRTQWQFWLNLGIGGIFMTFNTYSRKDK